MFKLILGQKLGRPECPYMRRWVFETPWFSIRLHHWYASDDLRHYHDHPWNYVATVLKGHYWDISPQRKLHMERGRPRRFEAEHKHKVAVPKGGCWTFLLCGPERRPKWGYWTDKKFLPRNRYFYKYGLHPCE